MQEKKAKKEKRKVDESAPKWEGNHPWRPFDREKDLDVSGKPADQKQFMSKVGDLSGRFGSSARKFL